MNKHTHQNFKQNWPLALVHKAQAAIKMIVSVLSPLSPFTLSLSKRRARLRQAQPERVFQAPTCRLHNANRCGAAA
ncbi:hypothetical protein [Acidovorax sp. M2(2025)]|uniref:hypothetical protein n=1 Tax=Acidovorax sp. M2(2025) TaxID=3411355 RepID=UPI003BF536B4